MGYVKIKFFELHGACKICKETCFEALERFEAFFVLKWIKQNAYKA